MKLFPAQDENTISVHTWIWFHPSSSLIGIVQMNGFTLKEKESQRLLGLAWWKFDCLILAWWWIGSSTPWTSFARFCHPKPDRWKYRLNVLIKTLMLYLHFKCEILLHVLDDHNKVGQLDPQCFLGVWKNENINWKHKEVLSPPAGQVIYVVETLVPTISRTKLCMSWSVILLMCPFRTWNFIIEQDSPWNYFNTFLSQICRGLDPML